MVFRAVSGFLLSLTPLSCTLMGWRGAGGNGAANIGVYLGFGGVLMILGAVGEVSSHIGEVHHPKTKQNPDSMAVDHR